MPMISKGVLPMTMTSRLPSGSSSGKHLAREQVADDYNLGAFIDFLVGEIAAAQKRNTHRTEVVAIHSPEVVVVGWFIRARSYGLQPSKACRWADRSAAAR